MDLLAHHVNVAPDDDLLNALCSKAAQRTTPLLHVFVNVSEDAKLHGRTPFWECMPGPCLRPLGRLATLIRVAFSRPVRDGVMKSQSVAFLLVLLFSVPTLADEAGLKEA